MMPDLDGKATLAQMRQCPTLQNTPAIFLTAKATAPEGDSLLALGIAGIITKPFKAQALVSQIKTCLNWQD